MEITLIYLALCQPRFIVMYIFKKISYFIFGLKIRKCSCFKSQKIYTDISKFSLIHFETEIRNLKTESYYDATLSLFLL